MTAERTSVGALLDGAAEALRAAGIDQPRLEARLLLGHALGVRQADLVGRRAERVAAPGFDAMVARRAAREPLALIVGHREFWSLDFAVSPATLVPRADSETVIEAALAARPDRGRVRDILDLGTGTGCLLLAALREFPRAWGVGVDLAPAAAALAARNAAALGLAGRAAFLCADWAGALHGGFDLVLANPPYIRSADIATLMAEVAAHEPALALDGGADGLLAYRAILAVLPGLLRPGAAAVLEIGQGQAADLTRLAEAAGLAVASQHADLGAVPRAVVLCRGG